jgi:hypothetical protein
MILVGYIPIQSRKVDLDGFGFVDSTKLIVCHAKRTRNHRIFKGYADVGMSSMGWFYSILKFFSRIKFFSCGIPLFQRLRRFQLTQISTIEMLS